MDIKNTFDILHMLVATVKIDSQFELPSLDVHTSFRTILTTSN